MSGRVADEPGWPNSGGRRIVFLLDASSALEERVLGDWVRRARPEGVDPATVEVIAIPPSRRRRSVATNGRLEACLATGDDPLLQPLRVAWMPPGSNGTRPLGVRQLVTGDPRDPSVLRQRLVLQRDPSRCRVLVAEPAPVSDLRARWQRDSQSDAGTTVGLPDFVARQAMLALERAERRLRGARYKVPRLVHEDILSRPAFRGGLSALARQLGRDEASVIAEAQKCLREIAATHSPTVIDLTAQLIRLLYTQGYGEALHYDRARLAEIAALGQRHPIIFLPSHRSNLDHLVLQYMLHEHGHPPNHTAGGINMNFFPVGPLVRRSGVFFIRRTMKDAHVYKFVLRSYIDYLIEKRFSMEWYIEGGRSRSGKLLPPMYGILAYVVDAYRRGKSDDVIVIPVSIAYDQIQDVGSYVSEQRGGAKTAESFGWFVDIVRQIRRPYGDIWIRFGEALSMREYFTAPPDPTRPPNPDDQELDLQKLAFEISVRINRATPITATSLVSMALLGAGDRALTLDEVVAMLRRLVDSVQRRQLPTAGDLQLDSPDGVRRTLEALASNGVVTCFAEGPEPVYRIGPDQHLTAAYYRNTIIHFFVSGAIAELAGLRAAEAPAAEASTTFWDEAMRLRDLLKFEFFFAEKSIFRAEVQQELSLNDPGWEARLAGGPAEIQALVKGFRPFSAHRVLRPFVEAYRVVADALMRHDGTTAIDEKAFITGCLALGKQYQLQGRIQRAESISNVLFKTALKLARNRGLVDPGTPDVVERRRAFAAELSDVIRRIDAIEVLAASRRAGLLD